MDPLSITVTAVSLAKVCGVIAVELGIFIQSTKEVESTIAVLQGDVQDFKTVLDLLHDTVGNKDVKDWIASTGRMETYWTSLAASLGDAESTMNALKTKTENINKSSRVFDAMRKQMRMKFAAEDIVMYRQQITRFKGTIQVVLNTTTIWHHASDKEVSEQVLPRLDETQVMIRELGLQFNRRMAALQDQIQSQPAPSSLVSEPEISQKSEYQALDNMRNCLRGAATVIVSASTVAGADAFDDNASNYGSDFGDVFPSVSSDQTLHWIKENASPEMDEPTAYQERRLVDMVPPFNEIEQPEEFDDDQGLEWEMRTACYELGSRCLNEGKYEEAQNHLNNSVDGLLEDQALSKAPKDWLEFLMKATRLLCKALEILKNWKELQIIYKKRLYIQSRLKTQDTEGVTADKMALSAALFECKEYQECLLYCRSAEMEYRKLGESQLDKRVNALNLISRVHMRLGSVKEAQRCKTLAEYLSHSRFTEQPQATDATVNITAKAAQLSLENEASSSTAILANLQNAYKDSINSSYAAMKSAKATEIVEPQSLTARKAPKTLDEAMKISYNIQVCRRGKVLYGFTGRYDDELSVFEDEEIAVLNDSDEEYYVARSLTSEREGDIPKSYVEILPHDAWIEAHKIESEFIAKEEGEISVAADEPVQVLKSERGSWWLVMLRTTGTQGWVPATFVVRYNLRPSGGTVKPEPSKVRGWKTNDGSFTVEAEFSGLRDGKVCLHKVNGVIIAVPYNTLSKADRTYLQSAYAQNMFI